MQQLRAEEAGGDAVMTDAAAATDSASPDELVVPEVPATLLAQLTGEMGFGASRRAVAVRR